MKTKTPKKDPYVITAKQARSLMGTFKEKGKLRVHTIDCFGPAIMGANCDLKTIMERLKEIELTEPEQIRLAGPNMLAMGHGFAFWKNDQVGYEYVQTDKKKLEALYKEVGLEFPKK